jgi:hypothetical protein
MPSVTRKLLRVEMIIDASLYYDLMMLIDGKAFDVVCRPVKHGGIDAESGTPKAMPSAPQFVAAYIAKHSRFKTRDVVAAGADLGVKKASINTAIYNLRNDGVLKQVGVAEWQVRTKASKKLDAQAKAVQKNLADNAKAAKPKVVRGKPGEQVKDKIIALLKSQGGEAPIKLIKDQLAEQEGITTSGVTSAMSKMLHAKTVKRVSGGLYRMNG